MSQGTRHRRRQITSLHEDVVRGFAPLGAGEKRVDTDKGVIYGVKVLGRVSANRRRYTQEAIADAVARKLWEGAPVFLDHPAKPTDTRPVRAKFGRLVNVRLIGGEPYADLEYLKSHPEAPLVVEVAQRMQEQLGISHNAEGEGHTDSEGIFVVERLTDVRSCDVVTEPATTHGFFEQRLPMKKIKLKALFESIKWGKLFKKGDRAKFEAAAKKRVGKLFEDDMMSPDQDMNVTEDDPAAVEPDQALRDGFSSACGAVIEKGLDGELDPKEALSKLKELLSSHAKLSGGDEEAVEEEDEGEEDKPEETEEACDPTKVEGRKPKVDPALAQLQEQVATLKRDKEAAELKGWFVEECGRLKVKPGVKLTETLLGLKDRKQITATLAELPKADPARPAPRSQAAPAAITEARDKVPTSGKEFADRLKAASY